MRIASRDHHDPRLCGSRPKVGAAGFIIRLRLTSIIQIGLERRVGRRDLFLKGLRALGVRDLPLCVLVYGT